MVWQKHILWILHSWRNYLLSKCLLCYYNEIFSLQCSTAAHKSMLSHQMWLSLFISAAFLYLSSTSPNCLDKKETEIQQSPPIVQLSHSSAVVSYVSSDSSTGYILSLFILLFIINLRIMFHNILLHVIYGWLSSDSSSFIYALLSF